VCRLCRREGAKLFLKGYRCYSPKCPIEQHAAAPGQHGDKRGRRGGSSDYRPYLREKQKVRRYYGVGERQFSSYFVRAGKSKGVTGEALLQLLERRLDNVVFRLGFASSRPEARQLVSHGHFRLNGHKANIPSMLLRVGDVVGVREGSRSKALFKNAAERADARSIPDWLQRDVESMNGSLVALPTRGSVEISVNERLIVEYYSR
jgi:small subunit ribosomal protein S4